MRSRKRETNHDVRRRATLAPGWWRTFGILCLQICLFGAATAMVSRAQDQQPSSNSVKFTTLLNFNGTDGGNPAGPLVQGLDGNLYGTAVAGGSSAYCPFGTGFCGTVFKITPSGSLTTLYSFCSQPNCADGFWPFAGLTLGTDGSFYGTTDNGGPSANGFCAPYGCGTTFKITPAGELTTLYDWCSLPNCADGEPAFGQFPVSLIPASDGNLYGSTSGGGVGPYAGTIFKLTPTGQLSTLYDFPDGSLPVGLTQGGDGNFYGTTYGGGAYGYGTVFKVTQEGALTTLYNFCSEGGSSCTDGLQPLAPLLEGIDGNFYGTTSGGGTGSACGDSSGCGTLFKITPKGGLTTIYNFCSQSNCGDGQLPGNTLAEGTDGNFYGETSYGGANGDGILFELTPAGVLTTLQSFDTPYMGILGDGVVQATNGYFYGPTNSGGTANSLCFDGNNSTCGTVFAVSLGLGSFVETLPTSGKVGETIKILGNRLADATGVSFNGVAATFKVASHTLISATVPAGATTGFVTVTTPSGTLKSNVKFQVRP
jgi:uncharacterized repeat protein (TIGR03803 family)